MGRNLRIAVIGMGKMGLLHSCILNVLPNVKVVSLCEKNSLTRRLLKKLFSGVRIVDDAEEFAGLDLDAVFVTTPIPSHYRIVKALFEKNRVRNLFVEKTLAASHSESRQLVELAEAFGGVNMVGYLRRFYVTFGKAQALLKQGVIGETNSFAAYAYSSDFLGIKENVATPLSRGGVLKDLGCHAVDLALWFFGDLKVRSAELVPTTMNGLGEHFDFNVKSHDGIEGELKVSWCKEHYRMPEVGFSIAGSKGILKVSDDKVELRLRDGKTDRWYRHDLNDNVPFWLGLPEYYREDTCFIESVLQNRNAEPSFYTASKTDEIIEQVEKRAGER